MLITPRSAVYKAASTGLLKAWLGPLPQFALATKVVLPLATGGSLAHALALDYSLRPVLSAMGARHVVQGYLVVDSFIESDRDGVTTISSEALPGLTSVIEGVPARSTLSRRDPQCMTGESRIMRISQASSQVKNSRSPVGTNPLPA